MPVPLDVVAARQQVIETDYYALGYLALCIASYSAEGSEPPVVQAAIAANVRSIGQIGTVPGQWTLDWGPAITEQITQWSANLLFAASYRDPDSNLPIFSAVIIRGTDTRAGLLGLLTQLHEDLDAGCQVPWPTGGSDCATPAESASATPYIAQGTFFGYTDLTNNLTGLNHYTNAEQKLGDFLNSFIPQYADESAPLPLVVTGHSLGGCQTSPVALYISQLECTQSGVTIVPNSFAAPTAGNGGFATLYSDTFSAARRWFNTFDLVPKAFDAMPDIQNLWSERPYTCGLPVPVWASPLLTKVTTEVQDLTYAHEGGKATRELKGSCGQTPPSIDPWGDQLVYQHFPACGYWALMVAQYGSVLGSLDFPSWAPAPPCFIME